MTYLKKWDQRVLKNGNKMKWESNCWFGVWFGSTQARVVGAWGRKRNLLKSGRWKGDNG